MHSDPHIIVRAFDPKIDHVSCDTSNVTLVVVEPIRDTIPDVPLLTEGMRFQPNRAQRRAAKKIRRSFHQPKGIR